MQLVTVATPPIAANVQNMARKTITKPPNIRTPSKIREIDSNNPVQLAPKSSRNPNLCLRRGQTIVRLTDKTITGQKNCYPRRYVQVGPILCETTVKMNQPSPKRVIPTPPTRRRADPPTPTQNMKTTMGTRQRSLNFPSAILAEPHRPATGTDRDTTQLTRTITKSAPTVSLPHMLVQTNASPIRCYDLP